MKMLCTYSLVRLSHPVIRLTTADEVPELEEDLGERNTLEIEYQDSDGKTKKMIIDYQEKEE